MNAITRKLARLFVGLLSFLLATQALAFYNPTTGRWLNRDPIEEEGGGNLFAVNLNDSINQYDLFGLKPGLQCEIDGKPVAFSFNGITLSGNGISLTAVSGVPVRRVTTRSWLVVGLYSTEFWHSEDVTFDYSSPRQRLRNVGPIPAGQYYIEQCEERSSTTSPWSHIVKRSGWGDYSWSLHPEKGTDTFGRRGFFIHGGNSWGSAGCIDLTSGDTALHDLLKRVGNCGCCFIPVSVGYSVNQNTVSEIILDRVVGRRVVW